MKMVISAGDRVRVTRIIKGYERGYYKGTVIDWTERGKLRVKADSGEVVVISSELVKKMSDGIVR